MDYVKLKDFCVGTTAYRLNMHHGRNINPEIQEFKVLSVGRKYVTIDSMISSQFYRSENALIWDGLHENHYSGENVQLFPDRQMAEDYIKRDVLLDKVKKAIQFDSQISLVQVLKICQVLGIDTNRF